MGFPLLVALGVLLAGIAVGRHVDSLSEAAASSIGPHLALLAAGMIALGGFAALAGMGSERRRARTAVLFALGFIAATGLLIAYIALFFCLVFLGEFPTRNLVSAHLADLPVLIDTLPMTRAMLASVSLGLALLLLFIGAVAGWCLAQVGAYVARRPRSRSGVPLASLLACAGAVYPGVSMVIPLAWQVDGREPFASSWHNVSVRGTAAARGPQPQERQLDRAACAVPSTPRRRPNVILVYVDALRADVTQPYGGAGARENMPFMTRMVREGRFVQADLAMAACTSTVCGLAALLQSRPARLQHPEFCSLPKTLKNIGYSTAYVLASNHQDFMETRRYYEPADFYVDGKDLGSRLALDDAVLPEGLRRLGPWQGRPVFLMIGMVSTHALGRRAESYRRFRPDYRGGEDASFTERYRNNYHNGVLQADATLAMLWDSLKLGGYLEDAIVIITSDHGESLGERAGVIGHMVSLDQAELHVPLWIHETRPTVGATRFARQVDVAPTVLAALGLPAPVTWHGRPLQHSLAGSLSEHVSQNLPQQVAVVHFDGETAIKMRYDRASTREQAFELFSDPREERDVLLGLGRERLQALRGTARAAFQATGGGGKPAAAQP
ncbi:MAG: sulfatase-like hydrolase/transferase [Burkholderiales bacterium]